jgi:hypothetical protein
VCKLNENDRLFTAAKIKRFTSSTIFVGEKWEVWLRAVNGRVLLPTMPCQLEMALFLATTTWYHPSFTELSI